MVAAPTKQKQNKIDRYLYLEEKERRYRENKFKYFVPNRHQKRFLGKTATCDELLFAGGNRTGKSTTGALGVTAWATGRYPSWWTGRRFDTPVRILVMGQTDVQLRKAAQRVLMGEEGQWGTGMLPKDTITDDKGKQTVYMKHDPRGCIDYIQVKSDFGGYSYIYFGTYGQGAEAQQGDELHAIWCDEPVDDDVYGELVARIVTTQGLIFITATPENTSSEILQRFYEINEEEQEDEDEETTKFFLCVSQDEVEHLTDEDREKFRKKLLPHQVQARVHGLFVLGDGQVFECTRDQITCDPFPLYEMEYLRLIIGLDFGYNDPTAAVLLASDPNLNGRVYVVRSYQQPFQLPPYHAIRIRAWGEDIPCAWPRDGFRVGVGSPSLLKIKDQYREAGLRMLPNPAFSTYNSSTEGSNLEAGIQMLYEAIHSDCLKIFDINENQDLIKRLIMYHRKDGKIPRQNAHKIDALRAGFCERKKARAIYQLERLKFGGGGKSKKAKTSFSLN